MKGDCLYIIHILECIERIEKYTLSGKTTFFSHSMTHDAVLRNLQTLAESVQRLSTNIRTAYPNISWVEISGFRNVVVHDYLGIDLEQIWMIIQTDLPKLKQQITQIKHTLDCA